MFGQIRSKNRQLICNPCPCLNICLCHYPAIKSDKEKRELTILISIMVFSLFSLIIIITCTYNAKRIRYIEVNGKMCNIVYIEDGINSTGAGYGHEKADCF